MLIADEFCRSHRSQEFLRFIVEAALDGRRDQLNERAIAGALFGRSANSVATGGVRVRATEVRRRLREFYSRREDRPWMIQLTAGSYVPKFIQLSE
jgi:hypothetical protein